MSRWVCRHINKEVGELMNKKDLPAPITCTQTLGTQPRHTGTHRLNQNIVLSIEQGGPGILVQRFYIVPGRDGWSVVHAATGMPLLDLVSAQEREKGGARYEAVTVRTPTLFPPCPWVRSRPYSRPSHCPPISHRAPAAW